MTNYKCHLVLKLLNKAYLTNACHLLLCETETRQGSISRGARLPLTPFGAPQHVQMLVSSHFDTISHQFMQKTTKNGDQPKTHEMSFTFTALSLVFFLIYGFSCGNIDAFKTQVFALPLFFENT